MEVLFGVKEYPQLPESPNEILLAFLITYMSKKRFLSIFQSEQHITAEWVQKHVESSSLLLHQTLKRFAKM